MPTRSKQPRGAWRVGVTGGIGSGKSFVCAIFRDLGRTILSADAIAHDLTDNDPSTRQAVEKLLGSAAYPNGGPLDRAFVASRVFADRQVRTRLNGIVFPLVFAALDKTILDLPIAQQQPYVVVEAALVYESGLDKKLDRVIVVEASVETRVRRVIERDGLSRKEVERRMAAQLPPETIAARADFLLRNDNNETPLRDKILFLDHLFTMSAQVST